MLNITPNSQTLRHKNSVFPLLSLILSLTLIGCSVSESPDTISISEEPAGTLTESAMDQDYLQSVRQQTAEAANHRLQQAYERNNIPQQQRNGRARVSGQYIRLHSRKLALLDLSYTTGPVRVTRITGLKAPSIVSISCVSASGKAFDISDIENKCGQAVEQIFGMD
ncbi:MAG: hypothetical protein DIZ77_15845 [endosymbiont of Seepiophila jonesi]|uniref:Uncharacterized protein n=1 Tax=endosymbiont of Lamellibrachia luymesi TaxID=2200907 RepID=A0A370E1J6_9GAMM|nr:MAG: hypothetical protein DIZ77_15845 [endosymbiont of Seepiophila jonesi]RDH93548.1 MAG: hypothetical protein DIZ79_00180 [endosymbiont of Lamellibrachia luymesi]